MWTITARSFPRWFIEGFAEYFAGVKFKADGSILFGAPVTHRAAELAFARDVPIRTLLEFDGGASQKKKGYDSFYGQSWILFHYLQTAPERSGQLQKYQQLLATGDTALEAAEGAFGDLDRLEKDMTSYVERSKVTAYVVNAQALKVGTVTVRPLRAGEAEMMPVLVESKAGVTPEEAVALLPEARRIAAAHPGDPAVLAALAEATMTRRLPRPSVRWRSTPVRSTRTCRRATPSRARSRPRSCPTRHGRTCAAGGSRPTRSRTITRSRWCSTT
jgi:hypothetical protein